MHGDKCILSICVFHHVCRIFEDGGGDEASRSAKQKNKRQSDRATNDHAIPIESHHQPIIACMKNLHREVQVHQSLLLVCS
jgi:hypothetical protein